MSEIALSFELHNKQLQVFNHPARFKVCISCNEEKEGSLFSKKSASKDGLQPKCKSCMKAYQKDYYIKNREKLLKQTSEWDKANPDNVSKRNKRWAKANKDYNLNRWKEYREANPHKVAEQGVIRRTSETRAKPKWANDKYISLFYKLAKMEKIRTGKDVHVDHIVPIRGKNVCGLHCEDNMQLLFAEDNLSKSNKFDV